MPLTFRNRAVALAAGIALAGTLAGTFSGPAAAKTETSGPPVTIGSFSGAYLAGRVAEADDDLDGAIAYYKRALTFDAGNEAIQQSLMLALISKGEFDAALPYADKLKTVSEIERFSRLALGVDAIRQGKYAQAETWLKIALESDLDRLIGGLMTAWAKVGDDDADGAIALVDQLTGPAWYDIFKSFHRALLNEHAGRLDAAEQAYRSTLTNLTAGGAAPDTYLRAAEAHARFLARQDRDADALKVLAKAEEFAAGRPQITSLKAEIEAGKTVSPFVGDIRQGAGEVLLDLASALNRGGGEAFVRLYLQYARALMPTSDAVLIQLGTVAEQQSDSEEAITYYGAVPDDSPLKRAAELQLGLNLADLERHDEAIQHLAAILEDDPDDVRAYLALGGVHAAQEQYRQAADVYDRAVARIDNPVRENWNVFYQRGIAYERLKEWPKAEPNFRKALELFPDQPQVLNYLGYSWVDMNMNLDEGLEMIRRAVALRPSDGYIVDSLGWAYFRLGRFEEAVKELERAVSLKPNDPILNDHLGDAYWRAGRRLEATFQWSHARDLEPDADVLASVQKKLAEGLPPEEERKAEAPALPAPSETVAAVQVGVPARPEIVEAVTPAIPAAHIVLPGQSLWSIAAQHLGDGRRYQEILDLNPMLQGDPGSIRPGQELILPGRSQ